jgi:hypothetical protein
MKNSKDVVRSKVAIRSYDHRNASDPSERHSRVETECPVYVDVTREAAERAVKRSRIEPLADTAIAVAQYLGGPWPSDETG